MRSSRARQKRADKMCNAVIIYVATNVIALLTYAIWESAQQVVGVLMLVSGAAIVIRVLIYGYKNYEPFIG